MADDAIEGSGVRVSFTVKELLGRIDENLFAINAKLDLKADHKDLERLADVVEDRSQDLRKLERRVEMNEKRAVEREESDQLILTKREKTMATVIALAAVATPYLLHIHLGGH